MCPATLQQIISSIKINVFDTCSNKDLHLRDFPAYFLTVVRYIFFTLCHSYRNDSCRNFTYVFALASRNSNPFSSANCFASSYVTSLCIIKEDKNLKKNIYIYNDIREISECFLLSHNISDIGPSCVISQFCFIWS